MKLVRMLLKELIRRKLGVYQRGNGYKVFFLESKVLAYKANQSKRSEGLAMNLPENFMDRSTSKKLDA